MGTTVSNYDVIDNHFDGMGNSRWNRALSSKCHQPKPSSVGGTLRADATSQKHTDDVCFSDYNDRN